MATQDARSELLIFWTRLAEGYCRSSPLRDSLRSLREDPAVTVLRSVISAISEDVETGMPLSEAMKRHPQVFRQHVLCFVEGGERAGILDRVLMLIVEFAWRCPDCILAIEGI